MMWICYHTLYRTKNTVELKGESLWEEEAEAPPMGAGDIQVDTPLEGAQEAADREAVLPEA